jgi:hypothetical protein
MRGKVITLSSFVPKTATFLSHEVDKNWKTFQRPELHLPFRDCDILDYLSISIKLWPLQRG